MRSANMARWTVSGGADEEPYPVSYYCGIRDPDGNFVGGFGQPLGLSSDK
jgi:hypothetical protein